MLGRGRFAHVIESNSHAIKIIDVDSQKPPHNWRAEVAALSQLGGKHNVISLIRHSTFLEKMDAEVHIEMPRYPLTLENVIYHYAKANYPPGSGWRNAMPFDRVTSIFLGVCTALQAVHSSGIIHRDIKPENILFSAVDSSPVLIDFGISWVPGISEPEQEKFTEVSTGEYKAPELLFGVRNYTAKVDMWALGCILARLLSPDCNTLFSPYRSDIALIAAQFQVLGRPDLEKCPSLVGSAAQSMLDHMAGEKNKNKPVLKLRPNVPAELNEMLHELLNYEMSERLSATEVLTRWGPLKEHFAED